MVAESNMESRRIRYLLGLCPQDERERIESEYFENDDAFHAMLAAEDDLTDAYSRGELTADEHRRFEEHFLTSLPDRDRVKFARALASVVSDAQPHETDPHTPLLKMFTTWRSTLPLATIVAVIVLVVSIGWLLIDRRRMNDEQRTDYAQPPKQTETQANQTRVAETTVQPENLSAHSDKPQTQPTSRSHVPKVKKHRAKIASISNDSKSVQRTTFQSLTTLHPGVVLSPNTTTSFSFLGSGRTTITVANSLNAITLRLNLDTPAQHTDYRAAIQAADGRSITSVYWTESLTPNRASVNTPAIPTDDLSSGDYVLLLAGKTPDGPFIRVAEYSFTVIRN